MKLYRPVGQKEYELIRDSGFTRFPPRLPEQPIFYPVLHVEYARFIASKWNVADKGASGGKGYVLAFEVDDAYAAAFPVQTVGDRSHQELWIPAEELDQFNSHILSTIQVLEEYSSEN